MSHQPVHDRELCGRWRRQLVRLLSVSTFSFWLILDESADPTNGPDHRRKTRGRMRRWSTERVQAVAPLFDTTPPRAVTMTVHAPVPDSRINSAISSCAAGAVVAIIICPTEEFPLSVADGRPWVYDDACVPGMSVPQVGVLCVGTKPLFSARSVQTQIGKSCPKTVEKLIVFGSTPSPL